MFAGGSSSYEVQTRRDGRWRIEGAFTDQEASLSCARSLLSVGGVDEVKVLKFRSLAGLSLETVILHKAAPKPKDRPLPLGGTAEGAPLCRTVEDLCGFESRTVIGRLLRPYLDAQRITPTELLHCWPHFRKLDEQGALLSAAIHAAARHHADQYGVPAAARAKEIRSLVDAAAARARDLLADRRRLPAFDGGDLAGTSRRIEAAVGEEAHDTVFNGLLAIHLMEGSSLPGKLELLLALVTADLEPRHLLLLDGVIADVLASAETLKDLLGAQPSLAAGLCVLADALQGRDPDPRLELPRTALAEVCDLALRGRAPCSRQMLLDRLRQALASDQPLDRRDPKAEGALIQTLTDRLKGNDGQTLGGAATVKALERRTLRYRQSILREQGMHDIADRLSRW